ncbi:hypothetical protein INP83_06805 [Mucilaginibacter sp. 21P]|uniref:hypothetical protein n=1 Tax=Mucilaginibacter sp. 21P TaxID=2778902 RepID=UPI001C573369|nr:hypothetical protein [Mucilaginibacter sp. 21P]QXV66789.1 hypothetical protein INP83_06805 [Mucilaginibacter sp. 21P]
MKLLFGCLVLVYCYWLPPQINDLPEIRKLAAGSTIDNNQARKFAAAMVSVSSADAPVMICYKGASVMIQAKYAFNPFVKFEKFKTGKALIEQAFQRDSSNVEIRLIRYSIQSNLPAFLGYHSEIINDRLYIQRHFGECQDAELKKMILSIQSLSGTRANGSKL